MELEFVAWLKSRLDGGAGLPMGIGDDAAVLDIPAGRQLVATTDMLVAGSHFDADRTTAEQIGRKALAVNLSDLAAMAATPLAAFVSLSLPAGDQAGQVARLLIEGLLPLSEKYDCPVAGGDTVVARGPLVVSVMALGTVNPGAAWLRSGATPGDRLLVTGQLGGSLAGRHLDFEPRVFEALLLHDHYKVHAAMDISDGLAIDLRRMTKESSAGAIVDTARVPISPAASAMSHTTGRSPLEHALGDGEDFELLLAMPPTEAERLINDQPLSCRVTDVGEFTRELSLQSRDVAGALTPLPATGYEH